jgi:hypothetical protein
LALSPQVLGEEEEDEAEDDDDDDNDDDDDDSLRVTEGGGVSRYSRRACVYRAPSSEIGSKREVI